jgi:hypothetical protein
MFKRIAICGLAILGIAAGADLPSAEAVFNKYIDATGGKAGHAKVMTMSSHGTVEIVGQGIKGTMTIVTARPDKVDTVMELPGIGKIRSSAVGGVVWQNSAIQGPRVLEGEERIQMLRKTRMDSMIDWRTTYGDVKVDGEEDVNGKPCWRLVAMPPNAKKSETLWFDKNSGFVVKSAATMTSPMGEVPTESTFGDYRDIGGIKVAFRMTQKVGPQTVETTMEEVKLNPVLPATQFDAPPEIQALLKKK